MYVKYNDYELIYLIKEGSERAKKYFFMKYTSLIQKLYREGFYSRKYYFSDFLQEGLMILEKTINHYNPKFTFDFYHYFKLCFSRRLIRLNSQGDMLVSEKRVYYKMLDTVDVNANYLRHKVERAFKDDDELSKKIIKECLFNNSSIQTFCQKRNLDYQKTYYLYRKIKSNLENLLTN